MKTKVERWPNGMGWNVTIGTRRFELWPSGSICQVRRDRESLTGWRGWKYCETGVTQTEDSSPVDEVLAALKSAKWFPCYTVGGKIV